MKEYVHNLQKERDTWKKLASEYASKRFNIARNEIKPITSFGFDAF